MRSLTILAALICQLPLLSGCGAQARERAAAATGGDPTRGVSAIERYGCGSCHTISGIRAAHGLAGPPLSGIGNRVYVAGELPNTPDNLMSWIRHPRKINEKTVMPELGVTEQDARDIAAFLYSID
jgi:cytochrome c